MPATRVRITIGELWHLALPPGTHLLGGAGGLSHPVEWITSLRASFPLFGAMEEGYLALARPELARRIDPRLTVSYLLNELSRAGASGLVIDQAITPEDAALADRLALPVLLLPEGADLHAVEREVLRALVDQEGQMARREMETRQRLQRIYGTEGLQGVLDEVARVAEAQVVVCEEGGTVLGRAGQEPARLSREGTLQAEDIDILVGGKLLGRLTLLAAAGRANPLGAVYGRQAADLCGIEMVQRRTRQETEERLGLDLVEQLLDPSKAEEEIASRLARLGYDTSPKRRHAAISLGGVEGHSSEDACQAMAQDLHWTAKNDGAILASARYRGDLLLFCSMPADLPERRLREWLDQALRRSEGRFSAHCSAGVGRVGEGIAGLRRSVRQALTARQVGNRVLSLESPYYYEQLGLYRLLTELRGRDELARFYDETLGDLVRYDRQHHTELVSTLEAFFAENANASRTARALYVHRNTLNYRLQRIAEITGLDLDDAEARLAFQLALKLHHIAS